MFNYIIIGAGFAGSVIAERITRVLNKKVLIIEKRAHIGGNCWDYRDKNGIIIHRYGPHLFHTDDKDIFAYLSNFTTWNIYHHKALAFVDGKAVPIPFNFNSIDILFPREIAERLKQKLLRKYQYGTRISIFELKKNKDKDLQFLAGYVYKKIFENYTKKQWGTSPRMLHKEVLERVPITIGKDNRYFNNRYQVVPEYGYARIFENMLNHPDITIWSNTNFKDVIDIKNNQIYFQKKTYNGILIFTGMIDELLNYRFGFLPYRTLKFRFKTIKQKFYQKVAIVNYPNEYKFTRITEFKHIHPVDTPVTKIVFEYPKKYKIGDIPYYPLFTEAAKQKYYKYLENTQKIRNLILVGRLAEYRYYDMDDVVKRALVVFEEKIK
ncbi:MAG: UDP-galactopyranose mutase [bacterium]|nr:UDP-galactopyranose mutase [bacterium]